MALLTRSRTSTAHLLKIGLLANAFEWYEFSVFGYLSIIIGKLFFHADTPIIEILRVFTLFAVSYLIRPLGSLFFGLVGDRRGRQYSLGLSLILMATPTIFIGCLPTYSDIGLSATIMLIALRMVQGFAMGGELPATACYVYESAPKANRSLFCATVGTATKIGLLLGSLTTYLLMRFLDDSTLMDWGWRIPFWLGVPLSFFIAYIRKSITETDTFRTIQATKPSPVIWHQFNNTLLQGVSLCLFLNVGFPILTIFMPTYLTLFLQVPVNVANLLNTISLCLMIPLCLGFGYLSQYTGYRFLFVSSILGTIIFSIPIFLGITQHTNFSHLLLLQCSLALLTSIGQGIFVEMIGDLFEAPVRSLGLSLSFIIPAALVGGTIPLVCTHIIHQTGCLMFPAYYMVLSGLIALPAALRLNALHLKRNY